MPRSAQSPDRNDDMCKWLQLCRYNLKFTNQGGRKIERGTRTFWTREKFQQQKKVMTVIWLKFHTKLSLCRSQATYFQVNVLSLLYRHSPVDFCLTWYVWQVSCCDLIQWHRHIKLIHCCRRRHLPFVLLLASWCRLHPGCRMPKMWWLMDYSFTDFLARVKSRHSAVCLSNKEYNTQ